MKIGLYALISLIYLSVPAQAYTRAELKQYSMEDSLIVSKEVNITGEPYTKNSGAFVKVRVPVNLKYSITVKDHIKQTRAPFLVHFRVLSHVKKGEDSYEKKLFKVTSRFCTHHVLYLGPENNYTHSGSRENDVTIKENFKTSGGVFNFSGAWSATDVDVNLQIYYASSNLKHFKSNYVNVNKSFYCMFSKEQQKLIRLNFPY